MNADVTIVWALGLTRSKRVKTNFKLVHVRYPENTASLAVLAKARLMCIVREASLSVHVCCGAGG